MHTYAQTLTMAGSRLIWRLWAPLSESRWMALQQAVQQCDGVMAVTVMLIRVTGVLLLYHEPQAVLSWSNPISAEWKVLSVNTLLAGLECWWLAGYCRPGPVLIAFSWGWILIVTEPYDAQVDPASPAMLAEVGAGQLTLVSWSYMVWGSFLLGSICTHSSAMFTLFPVLCVIVNGEQPYK